MSSVTRHQGRLPRWSRLFLPLLAIVIGAGVALLLVQTGPAAKREPPPRQARLVEVDSLDFAAARTVVEAMGTVIPAQEVTLQAQVGGEVVALSEELEPGGLFKAGDELLRIDPRDYELAVLQRESDVAQAQSELILEQGQQAIAKREFELLNEPLQGEERDLVLRKPQLKSVRARLALAEAALQKAKLDLERTRVRAPFNAVVQARAVDIGARVTTANTLATLAGTDRCWVEVTVPVRELQWIRVAGNGAVDEGSKVRILNPAAWGEDAWREGRVIRLAGELEDEGRMARLMVEVDDPFALAAENSGRPVMLMGSYVRAAIEGRPLARVAKVSRQHVHDGNRLWIMGAEERLEIREVEIAFRGREEVLVSGGIEPGERLVVSDLAAPVDGMPLRLREAGGSPPGQIGEAER